MTPIQATSSRAHVDAYCSTGSSPGPTGRTGQITRRLRLDHHGPLELTLGYEEHGPEDAPPVVVLGGISASRHLAPTPDDPAPGWWPGVVGRGAALDPCTLRLVGVDYLGGPDGAWRPSAPLTTTDQARGVSAVLEHLGVRDATVVGASYGGMVALALGVHVPERIGRLVVLCATHRPHPAATAVRAVQRDILRVGLTSGREAEAVALARALAMTTYRTEIELDARFGHRADVPRDPVRFPVESYVQARGRAFARRFDATAFLRLSESVDLHDVKPEELTVPLTLVGAEPDVLAPSWLIDELAGRAGGAVLRHRIASPYGHDAFLKETSKVSRILRDALREVVR